MSAPDKRTIIWPQGEHPDTEYIRLGKIEEICAGLRGKWADAEWHDALDEVLEKVRDL